MRSTVVGGNEVPDEPVTPLGRWWRHGDYLLVNGLLRPAPATDFEVYDPWEERNGGKPSAYVELANLCRELPLGGEFAGPLDPALARRVLDWCRCYGLPGTLVHRTEAVFLAHRWEQLQLSPNAAAPLLLPTQIRYFSDSNGWGVRQRQLTSGTPNADLSDRGCLVDPASLPPGAIPPVAFVRSVGVGGLEAQTLAQSWARFFPDVPPERKDDFPYPAPKTPEFVATYAEPLADFIEVGNTFAETIDGLSTSRAETGVHPGDAERRLGSLLAGNATTVWRRPDGKLRERTLSRSLIGTMAAMALEDLVGGRLRRCVLCDRIFRTSSYQGVYCSPRCRNTFQKRAQRARSSARAGPGSGNGHDSE
jgi:hypothetical protein